MAASRPQRAVDRGDVWAETSAERREELREKVEHGELTPEQGSAPSPVTTLPSGACPTETAMREHDVPAEVEG